MSRYFRNTAIMFGIENVSYGVAPVGGVAAPDAVLISNATFSIARDVVPRELIRPWMGGSEHLMGTRRTECEFDVELQGKGTAGSVPDYGKLLRACGMAEVITVGNRVEYTPVSEGFESGTLVFYIDRVRYTSRGARGNVQIMLNAYQRPMLRFSFKGFDTTAAEMTLGAVNFDGYQRPDIITDANAGDIRLGGTYATGVVSGGTVLPSRGLDFDLGQKVEHLKILGGESIDIVARETSGKMSVFLTAAQEVTWRDEINTNTLTTLGFNFGTTAGRRITVFCPAVQRVNPQIEDYEGRVMMTSELRVLPSGSGNNDLRLVVR